MKTSAIISEYNPFHNGHRFHIEKTRQNGATHIVAIMSGSVVQRGDVALINKHERAKIAVLCGADLVIELPVPYSISSAESFARGAISIIDRLGCVDEVSFGSEAGSLQMLGDAVNALENSKNSNDVKAYLSQGLTYPHAISEFLKSIGEQQNSETISSPNNVLGIEYIKALSEIKSAIVPFTIARQSVEHDSEVINKGFASASKIRKIAKENGDFSELLPNNIAEIVKKSDKFSFNNLEKIIFFKLLSLTKEDLVKLPDCDNGLSDRIFDAVRNCNTVDELLASIKAKCFTMAKIRRVIFYALLGITKSDLATPPPYTRILACNTKGTEVLRAAKKVSTIPISHSLAALSKLGKQAERFCYFDEQSAYLQWLAADDNLPPPDEFRRKFKIIN